MCVIRYLTDVTPETPAFAVVPNSRLFSTLTQAREALGKDYHEVPLVRERVVFMFRSEDQQQQSPCSSLSGRTRLGIFTFVGLLASLLLT